MASTSTPNDLLTALLPEWQWLLQAWSASGALTAAAQEALVLKAEPEPLKRLVSQWSQGDFSGLPPIVLLPASSMPGAAGAYAIRTGTIYLNQDWLATASAAQAMAVLTEELGHYLDGLLNAVDTLGDEGELFARLLAGEKLSAADLLALRTQADQTQVWVNGQNIAVEAAIDLTPPRPGGDNPETLSGTSGDDLIDGYGGDDTIEGLAGNDILIGGDGNDSIDGGTGINLLLGGAGDDLIISQGNDRVDAGQGNNIIQLINGAFDSRIAAGAGDDTIIIELGVAGSIIVSTGDGLDIVSSKSRIAQLDSGLGEDLLLLSQGFDYYLRSGEGNDTIVIDGVVGLNTLYSNDYGLYAGAGDDSITLSGGSERYLGRTDISSKVRGEDGNDIIILLGNKDYGVIAGDAGNDIIDASKASTYFVMYGGAGNDTIIGTVTADNNAFGDDGNDWIDLGAADDTGFGGSGDDTFVAGAGNDTFYGYALTGYSPSIIDSDTIVLSGPSLTYTLSRYADPASGWVYLISDRRASSPDGTDTFAGVAKLFFQDIAILVEDLYASQSKLMPGSDLISGTVENDVLDGRGGNDEINGLEGNDIIIGGEGDDTLKGGAGSNQIYGDAGDDLVLAEGYDIIYAGDGLNAIEAIGRLSGITCGSGEDHITLRAGFDFYLRSGGGNDIIMIDGVVGLFTDSPIDYGVYAGAGNDSITLSGGSALSLFRGRPDYSAVINGEDGNDVVILLGNNNYGRVLGDAGDDLIDASQSSKCLQISGGEGNDTIIGTVTADNNAFGDDGNDWMDLGAADDTGFGGSGDDTFVAGAGNDTFYGYALTGYSPSIIDSDTIVLSGPSLSYTLSRYADPGSGWVYLISDRRASSPDGTDTFAGVAKLFFQDIAILVEDLYASQSRLMPGSDLISGTVENDVLDGRGGNDEINGLEGNDIIIGGEGDDALKGGAGSNQIYGDAGGDIILAEGYDIIYAGEGANAIEASNRVEGITCGSGEDHVNLRAGFDFYLRSGGGNDTITIDGVVGLLTQYYIDYGVYAGAGDDLIALSGGSVKIEGRPDLSSIIRGEEGNDAIILLGNNDYGRIFGDAGSDQIDASRAQTVVQIDGGTGDDVITGTANDDNIWGGTGDDLITAGNGNNYVYAEDGNDTVNSSNGNSGLYGGSGNDSISSGDGNDNLFGEDGTDSLNAGAGLDTLQGGAGSDNFRPGAGNDLIYGGSSTAANTDPGEIDTLVLTGNASDYTISRATDVTFDYAYCIQDNRIGSPDGLDTLYDIDQLQFNDGIVITPIDKTPVFVDNSLRFSYIATALSADLPASSTAQLSAIVLDGGVITYGPPSSIGAYGSLTVSSTGATSFTGVSAAITAQATSTLTDSFSVTASNGGQTATATYNVAIANPSAENILLITATASGSIDGISFGSTATTGSYAGKLLNSINLGSAADTATLIDAAGTSATLTLNGGNGFDRLNGNASANNLTLTGLDSGTLDQVSFSSIENIYLQGGNDTVTIAAGGRLSGILDGGAGSNTLIVDDTFVIGVGTDGSFIITDGGGGSGGSFTGFGTIQGGGGGTGGQSNSLTLNANSNVVAITGPNSGTADGTAFTNLSDINLAAGDDYAILAAVGSLSGTLAGGDGVDDFTLNASANTLSLNQSGAGTVASAGNAVSTAFNGFEVIRLDTGSDAANLTFSATTALVIKQQLRLEGGLDNDTITLTLSLGECQNLQSSNQLTVLEAYLAAPTGKSITVHFLQTSLTLSGFESGVISILPPTYGITPSSISINEGSTLTTTVSTTNVTSGTTLYYALSGTGITAADFSSGALSGSGTVGADGTFSFAHTLANDLTTEGDETLQIKLFSDSGLTVQVGSTASVIIKDTSVHSPKSQWLAYSGQATDDWSGGAAQFSNGDIATAYSVSSPNGSSSVVLQRLSTSGAIIWSLDIGADYAPGAGSVLIGSDDKVYVTGGTKKGAIGESGLNDSDVFAAAISSTGQKLWYKNYGIGIHEIGSTAVLDANGNILLEGRVSEVNDGYSFIKDVPNFYGAEFTGGWRGFQLRISTSDGAVSKAYTTGSGNSGGGPIAIDRTRNIAFVAGYTFGAVNGVGTIGNGDPSGANTYLIARNETTGEVVWTRMENWMRSNVIAQDAENAVYFVDKGNLEKVNVSTGQVVWSKVLVNANYILSPITGGGVLLSESQSNGILTIRRFDSNGTESGSQTITHTGILYPRSFIEKGDGTLLVSGSTTGTITVGTDTIVTTQKQSGTDSFVLQINSSFSDAPSIADLGPGTPGTITSSSPGVFEEGVTLIAPGVSGDPNGDSVTPAYTYQWFLDGNAIAAAATSSYLVPSTAAGTYKVAISYTDNQGFRASVDSLNQVVTAINNGNGTCGSITSSTTGVFQEGVTLTAPDVSGDPDGDATVRNYAYQWYKDNVLISGATTNAYLVPSTGAGTYKVAITYADNQGFTASVDSPNQVVTAINNGNGTCGSITSSTAGVFQEGVTLTAPDVSADPDGDATVRNYAYQWYKDNVLISGATTNTYLVPSTGAGTYKVAITYADNQGFTASVDSPNQVVTAINNGNGTCGSITSSTAGVFQEGVTLTAPDVSGDPDGDSAVRNYVYQWYRDNVLISGATTSTYLVPNTGAGTYKVAIAYTDNQGFTVSVDSPNQVITAINNGNGTPGSITSSTAGVFQEGVTLTAPGVSGDPDGDAGSPNYAYQWFKDNVLISGASTSSYLVPSVGAGTYKVAISYSDNQGFTASVDSSSQVVTAINNGNGTAGSITSSTAGVFQEGVTLTAPGVSADPDGDAGSPNYAYQWFKDGTQISGATSSTYVVPNTGAGTYKVAIVYSDAQGYRVTVNSADQVVAIANNGNGTPGSITSSTAGVFQEGITLTAPGVSGDPDGDAGSPNYAYQWFKDGTQITGATSSTYAVPNTGAGTYKVAIIYSDAQGYRVTVNSADQVVAIANNGNGTTGSITSSTAGVFQEGVTLTAPGVSGDPDGDAGSPNYAYQWFKDGTQISGATGSSYVVPNTGAGTYKVAIVYSDAQGYRVTVNSADQVVAIANNGNGTPGSITSSTAGVFQEGVTLTAPGVTGDPDSDAVVRNYAYQWYKDNVLISAATTSSYLVPSVGAGTYKVAITYTDNQGFTASVESPNQVVTAAPPVSDSMPPTIASISTQGSTVILQMTEAVTAASVPISAFSIATVSSTNVATARTIATVALDQNNPSRVILTLTGAAPASTVNLRVSYADPAGNQATGVIQDLAGNDLATFSNRFADTFITSATTTLASQYQNLTLTGTSAINGTGNALNNLLIGNSVANILSGAAGNDSLSGGLGNDSLNGGAGNDTMVGGLGDDTYVVDVATDVITELVGEGTDLVQSAVTFSLAALVNVENLTLTGSAAINGTGNDLNNLLSGNAAANNLSGGLGNDSLNGGAGSDTMVGGAGDDSYVVDVATDVITELAGEGSDLVQSSITFSLAAQSNVENLTLTGTTAVNGSGNALNNLITGNSAANTLNGGDGNDSLVGAAGNDSLNGGAGNDILTGGVGADIYRFDTALNASTNVDRITDFTPTISTATTDRIQLENTGTGLFTAITATGTLAAAAYINGAAFTTAAQRIRYESTTGNLFYDADGSGIAQASILFATLNPALAINNTQFVVT